MLPLHVGIIPDGNRRWARKAGVGLRQAYQRGYNRLMRVVDYLAERGVKYLTVYVLSRENCLRRSRVELEILRTLSLSAMDRLLRDRRVMSGEARVIVLGDPGMVGEDVAEKARILARTSRWGTKYLLALLYCYSDATERERINRGLHPASSIVLPPLDLLIRTGGYRRLSGFLIPLASYAEIYTTETLWPDISVEEIEEALNWFSRQKRNFGR